jgi:hypothetical protein
MLQRGELITVFVPICTIAYRLKMDLVLACRSHNQREKLMLESVAIILIVLWTVGLVSSYTMGGFIHILILLAVVVVAIRLIQGRKL